VHRQRKFGDREEDTLIFKDKGCSRYKNIDGPKENSTVGGESTLSPYQLKDYL
jgi:hypothetical protein